MELTAAIYQDELVARCKQGDAPSFERLYRQYAKAMYNTSLRIVNNVADAEDVLQESFVAAFQLDKFDYSSTFGAWLKRIVINKSIDLLRRKKVQVIQLEESSIENLTEEIIAEENTQFKVEEVKKAVAGLPDGYRAVISLSLFEGYDYEEISEILNITESTVRTQYHRARLKLLHTLQKGGQNGS